MTGTAEPAGLAALRARRRELAAAIAEIGFTTPGTVLQVRAVCGTVGCACHLKFRSYAAATSQAASTMRI